MLQGHISLAKRAVGVQKKINREIEEKLRKLASVDKDVDSSWLLYLSGEGQERERADELIDIILHKKIQKDYKEKIFLDPPNASDCYGQYSLGNVIYPPDKNYSQFGLRVGEWIKHILITGMTGTGKTNLAFQIVKELKRNNKPFLVFDWKKNYRDLLQLRELKDTLVFTIGRNTSPFHFNPLIPPKGTDPGEWLTKLCDIANHAYFGGQGVEHLLREAIDFVYEECGLFKGDMQATPVFYHLRDYISKKHLKGRMSLWKASTMRILESLCFKHGLGPVLNVNMDNNWDYNEILNSNVIFELDALSDSDKIFFTEAIILWIYEYRKNEGKREEFNHALLIEEAHHILSHKKESIEGSETIMETCLRQIREFGESVICIDQEPTKLSNSIKANTYCKITFNLGNGKDILEIANCMGLNKEESEYIHLLDIGQAIVSLKGRVFVPLHVVFPKINVKKGLIRDSDVVKV